MRWHPEIKSLLRDNTWTDNEGEKKTRNDRLNNPQSRRRRMQTLRDQKDIKPTMPTPPWEEGEDK